MEGKSVFLRKVETRPLGRREGWKGLPYTDAEEHWWMTAGGGSFIPAPALQPGWRSKLGLLEGLGELQGEESQNLADVKCYLQIWSPARAKGGLGPGRESISMR